MIKLTYIVSDIDKALAFEWVTEAIDRKEFKLDFILIKKGDSYLEQFLKESSINVSRIELQKGFGLILVFVSLWWHLLLSRPDVVHTHLRYGTLLGITAAFFAGIKKRIHTRHHASSNHDYFPHAVKTDRWVTMLSTKVVAISDVVKKVLIEKENAPKGKVVKIPHGFNFSYFENVEPKRVEFLKRKYATELSYPVIGSISRYMELKGCIYTIQAFKKVIEKHPRAHLILANAKGPDKSRVQQELATLPTGSFTEIPFETDLAALYRLFDVFVHVPIREDLEAFGQIYIESLICGIPGVFTKAGIADEMMINGENAILVNYHDHESISEAIFQIISNPDLRLKLIKNGRITVRPFAMKPFIAKLESLYRG